MVCKYCGDQNIVWPHTLIDGATYQKGDRPIHRETKQVHLCPLYGKIPIQVSASAPSTPVKKYEFKKCELCSTWFNTHYDKYYEEFASHMHDHKEFF